MLRYASLLFVVFGVALAKGSNKAICDGNGTVILLNSTSPPVSINCQTGWSKLDVVIDGGNDTEGGLSLNFASVTNFKDKTIKISAVIDGTDKPIYEGKPLGVKFWMVTGQTKIRIQAESEAGATISAKVERKCGGTFDLPTFVSPLLPDPSVPHMKSVTCNFDFTKPATIEFTKFTLVNDSEAKFTLTDDESLTGPFTDKGPDHILIVKPNSVFSLKLDLSNKDQNVSFNRQIVSDAKTCGGKSMIKVDSKQTTLQMTGSKTEAVACSWLLVAPEGKKLTLDVTNVTLAHIDDIASVVDAGDFSGTPLLQVTALNRKTSPVVSSGRYLVVSLDSKDFDAKEGFGFSSSVISNGGHLVEKGILNIAEESNFILTTSDTENLVVAFTELKKLNDGQTIVVRANSVEIASFVKDKKLFDLASPGSELQVIAKGFPTTAVEVNFTSIPKDSGCSRTFTAPEANSMRLIGDCDGECTWIVRPNVPADITQLFMKVLPNNVPTGSIQHFTDAPNGGITLNNTSQPFMTGYPVYMGALIEFDCSNAKDFEMSYVAKPKDWNLGVTVAAARNFSLTSPFFPGVYPQGQRFEYTNKIPDEKGSYLATFHIMDLQPGHTLSLGAKGTVNEFSGSDLPGDILIPASTLKNGTFEATNTSATNPKGHYGFHINFAPTAASQTLTARSASVVTGDTCKNPRCVYIIEIPKPTDVNASISVNLTVTIPKNETLNDTELLIWDGESSLRSPLLASVADLKKGGFFASRSNKVIIVYTGAPKLTLSYNASDCSYAGSTMCLRERLCMPYSWRCDGQPRCSDGSDEFQCTNGHPPAPQPTPAPTSSSGWKTAFWLFMPLFILLGVALDKGVPMLIQRLRDSRYQQFHDLGDH